MLGPVFPDMMRWKLEMGIPGVLTDPLVGGGLSEFRVDLRNPARQVRDHRLTGLSGGVRHQFVLCRHRRQLYCSFGPTTGLHAPVNGCTFRGLMAEAPTPELPLFEYVLDKLESSKGKWSAVAEGSGVSYRTLEKIARGEIKDPGISHVQKLADYFRAQAA